MHLAIPTMFPKNLFIDLKLPSKIPKNEIDALIIDEIKKYFKFNLCFLTIWNLFTISTIPKLKSFLSIKFGCKNLAL